MSIRREGHYQFIRYLKGGYSLKDAKRLMTVGTVASRNRHMDSGDKQDLLQLDGALSRIVMTRSKAISIMKVKFAPRRATRREEVIGQMLTGYKTSLPHQYTRETALQRKPGTKPSPPRIGSSKPVIQKTTVTGAKRVLTDFKGLIRVLQRLVKKHGGNTRDLKKQYKKFRVTINSRTM